MTGFPGVALMSLKAAFHGEYLAYLFVFLSGLIFVTTAINVPSALKIPAGLFGGTGIFFGAVLAMKIK